LADSIEPLAPFPAGLFLPPLINRFFQARLLSLRMLGKGKRAAWQSGRFSARRAASYAEWRRECEENLEAARI
jgi:hypothetical protein